MTDLSPYEFMAREFERLAILRKMWNANEVAAILRRHDIERPATQSSALDAAEAREAKLREALDELHKLVWGECSSLLNEDSGGYWELDLRIRELLEPRAALAQGDDK